MRLITLTLVFALITIFTGCGGPGSDGGIVVLDGPVLETVGQNGDFEFNGVVTNISTEPVKSVFVVVLLKDENGNVIEANSVSISGDSEENVIFPSESAFFKVSFQTDPTTVFSKDVEIYFDEIEAETQ